MSGIVMAAMPRVTRRYDNAAAANHAADDATFSHGAGTVGDGKLVTPPGAYGYGPVVPTDPALHCVTFKWARACSAYSLRGATAVHSGGGLYVNRPVIGDLAMPPASGRYFYEIRINSASCKVGLCTQDAYPTEADLETCELGQLPPQRQQQQQQASEKSEGVRVAILDGQTSRVFVNGKEVKQLWRLFVATCGALFSFVVDTNEGVVQLFVDRKYVGMVFDSSAGLKGKTLYPCVSLAGLDMHNRSIGSGNLGAVVCAAHKFDCLY